MATQGGPPRKTILESVVDHRVEGDMDRADLRASHLIRARRWLHDGAKNRRNSLEGDEMNSPANAELIHGEAAARIQTGALSPLDGASCSLS